MDSITETQKHDKFVQGDAFVKKGDYEKANEVYSQLLIAVS